MPGSGSKLQDALGNAAAALTDEAVTNDTAKPTVVIASAGAFPTKDAFAVTITFSEAVTGFAVEEIEVTEGAASNFSGSGTVYEIEVTPAADYAGDVTVTVAADAADDSNGVGNASASKAFAVDAKGPVLDSATVAGNTLVLTYDEALGAATPDGERVHGDGRAVGQPGGCGAGGQQPGDGVGPDGDADAGDGGGGGRHGSGELHGAGERFEAAGRAGQRGGGADG